MPYYPKPPKHHIHEVHHYHHKGHGGIYPGGGLGAGGYGPGVVPVPMSAWERKYMKNVNKQQAHLARLSGAFYQKMWPRVSQAIKYINNNTNRKCRMINFYQFFSLI